MSFWDFEPPHKLTWRQHAIILTVGVVLIIGSNFVAGRTLLQVCLRDAPFWSDGFKYCIAAGNWWEIFLPEKLQEELRERKRNALLRTTPQ